MEKNRNILTDALGKLPVYTPDENIWDELTNHLQSKTTSTKLLRLTNYDPPESIWGNIDEKLSQKEKLSSLKEYSPPENIWNNIDQDLSAKKISNNKKQIVSWMKLSSVAAAIFILGYFIFITVNNSKNNFSYSEEWLELTDVQNWNEEENSIDYVLNLMCNENPKACKSAEFLEMDEELKFLDQAKQAILQQLNKYDTNTKLEILLTEIELERTSLIKEMIAKTI